MHIARGQVQACSPGLPQRPLAVKGLFLPENCDLLKDKACLWLSICKGWEGAQAKCSVSAGEGGECGFLGRGDGNCKESTE